MQHQIVFIVDDARLEAQALLLAASLRNTLGPGCQILAYAPHPRVAGLSDLTRRLFDRCAVELRGFAVPAGTWRKPYPHGNKIIALADAEAQALAGPATAVRRITFLDTDMICQGDFLSALPEGDQVMAVPEGVQSWGKHEEDWARAYGFFGLALPAERVQLLRQRRKLSLPYFNAGMVSFPVVRSSGERARFAAAWLDTARRFDHCAIANKRPWLDQITLPLTLYRHGFSWAALPKTFNYSASNLAQFAGAKKAHLLHYHQGPHLARVPRQRDRALRAALSRLPAEAHAALLRFLETNLALGLHPAKAA